MVTLQADSAMSSSRIGRRKMRPSLGSTRQTVLGRWLAGIASVPRAGAVSCRCCARQSERCFSSLAPLRSCGAAGITSASARPFQLIRLSGPRLSSRFCVGQAGRAMATFAGSSSGWWPKSAHLLGPYFLTPALSALRPGVPPGIFELAETFHDRISGGGVVLPAGKSGRDPTDSQVPRSSSWSSKFSLGAAHGRYKKSWSPSAIPLNLNKINDSAIALPRS